MRRRLGRASTPRMGRTARFRIPPGGASAEVHWLTIDGAPVIVAFLAPGEGLHGFLLDGDPILRSIHFRLSVRVRITRPGHARRAWGAPVPNYLGDA